MEVWRQDHRSSTYAPFAVCGLKIRLHTVDGNMVVHSGHSWAIFQLIFNLILHSFSGIWQRNKQKGTENEMKNNVKNVYCEHPGNENLEKWSENAFYMSGTVPERWKMNIFRIIFCKTKGMVWFNDHFPVLFHFILSFIFEKNGSRMITVNDPNKKYLYMHEISSGITVFEAFRRVLVASSTRSFA